MIEKETGRNAAKSKAGSEPAPAVYDNYIDRLILYFTADKFREDVAMAKKEFFDESGVVDEESPLYEMRVTQFLEWYLFTRRLVKWPAVGVGGVSLAPMTPAEYALQLEDFEMTSEERPLFESLACIRHSLFEFQKIRGEDIYVKDLWLGKKIVIPNSPINIGFNRDEIFDARLIPDGESFRFARSFCFHPSEASKYILGEIKRIRKLESRDEEESFMLRLIKMRYKYEQYRHLKLEYVYTNEKKIRF